MNYRHIYHAGSFSDVFKHVLLVALIQCLLRKDKPFCYLDTHAGIGDYDLHQISAQKTLEFMGGIFKLLQIDEASLPLLIKDYLQIVQTWNAEKGATEFHHYPGSPVLVRKLLRVDDKMILTELHPDDVLQLKQVFAHDKQVSVHHLDGYQAFKAFLPPKEGRGLILIDPPFEKTDEFERMVAQLKFAVDRWPAGIYAIWYPIKNNNDVRRFYQDLMASGIREILCCEMHLSPVVDEGLHACGMVVVHPPWRWKEEIEKVLPMLCEILSESQMGNWNVKWLVPE